MIRTMLIADSGRALADLTAALLPLRGAAIVRYAHARTDVAAVARAAAPDLVLIDGGGERQLAVQRATEAHAAARKAVIVIVRSAHPDGWTSAAPFGGGPAAIATELDAESLRAALLELLAQRITRPRADAIAA